MPLTSPVLVSEGPIQIISEVDVIVHDVSKDQCPKQVRTYGVIFGGVFIFGVFGGRTFFRGKHFTVRTSTDFVGLYGLGGGDLTWWGYNSIPPKKQYAPEKQYTSENNPKKSVLLP